MQQTLQDYLNQVAAKRPVPGGGSVAAYAASLGASLAEKVAAYSRHPGAGTARRRAKALRRELAHLAERDAQSYLAVVRALKHRRGLAAALEAATRIPVRVVQLASETRQLALSLARHGNRQLKSDAACAAHLSAAGVRAAAAIARANLKHIRSQAFIARMNAALRSAR
ncbi:MAG: cyclodeaminase/cyclohydrolase family protein [Candidatus Omnitrophica bacterium]|nr:cyclodeaminase/cyclohydrolase family protein [Candidatus Omnitrophota bacterium]